MKTIWKYPVTLGESNEIEHVIPLGGRVIALQSQKGVPTIWVEVDDERPKTLRRFVWIGTGHKLPDASHQYIGTMQAFGGDIVLHLYSVEV